MRAEKRRDASRSGFARPRPRIGVGLALMAAALGGCAAADERIEIREGGFYGDSARWSDAGSRRRREPLPAPPADPEGSDLASYVRFGLQNNAALRAAFDRWIAALERVPQATSLPDPRFSYAYFIEPVETRTGPQRNRFGLAQTFPWFGKLDLRGEVAERQAEMMWWQVEAQRLGVVREIKLAYHEYGYLAHAIRITEQNLELLRQLEPVVQRRIQAGGEQAELVRLQVEIGKLENELATLRARGPALSARLDSVLNREGDGALPPPQVEGTEPVSLDEDALRARLIESNPELHALRESVLREGKRVELAELEGYPDVTLGLDFFETGSAVIPNQRGSGDDPLALGFSINIPIWRQRYSAAEREARAGRRAAEGDLTERENRLRAMLADLLFELEDAWRQVGLYRDTLLPRARQALEVTEAAYQTAKASLTDVIDAQRQLLAFERWYWRAVARHEQRIADMEALVGGAVR